ncbi:MAG: nucleotidyl transferase AbiEii/AbiGii toxin family protein [Mycobacterium sp.]
MLASLDASVLESASCFFGGGTAIALVRDEFQESTDIDFIVSDVAGYRYLRSLFADTTTIEPITCRPLTLARNVNGDQYGFRTLIDIDGVKIKFEIVHEGRIDLDPVALGQTVGGVRALSVVDMAATKLLANDDRWADSSVHCRDVIDLAMLDASAAAMATASAKVRGPYPSAIRSLNRAIDHLLGDPSPLPKYMQALGISPSLHSDIVFKIGKLNGVQ